MHRTCRCLIACCLIPGLLADPVRAVALYHSSPFSTEPVANSTRFEQEALIARLILSPHKIAKEVLRVRKYLALAAWLSLGTAVAQERRVDFDLPEPASVDVVMAGSLLNAKDSRPKQGNIQSRQYLFEELRTALQRRQEGQQVIHELQEQKPSKFDRLFSLRRQAVENYRDYYYERAAMTLIVIWTNFPDVNPQTRKDLPWDILKSRMGSKAARDLGLDPHQLSILENQSQKPKPESSLWPNAIRPDFKGLAPASAVPADASVLGPKWAWVSPFLEWVLSLPLINTLALAPLRDRKPPKHMLLSYAAGYIFLLGWKVTPLSAIHALVTTVWVLISAHVFAENHDWATEQQKRWLFRVGATLSASTYLPSLVPAIVPTIWIHWITSIMAAFGVSAVWSKGFALLFAGIGANITLHLLHAVLKRLSIFPVWAPDASTRQDEEPTGAGPLLGMEARSIGTMSTPHGKSSDHKPFVALERLVNKTRGLFGQLPTHFAKYLESLTHEEQGRFFSHVGAVNRKIRRVERAIRRHPRAPEGILFRAADLIQIKDEEFSAKESRAFREDQAWVLECLFPLGNTEAYAFWADYLDMARQPMGLGYIVGYHVGLARRYNAAGNLSAGMKQLLRESFQSTLELCLLASAVVDYFGKRIYIGRGRSLAQTSLINVHEIVELLLPQLNIGYSAASTTPMGPIDWVPTGFQFLSASRRGELDIVRDAKDEVTKDELDVFRKAQAISPLAAPRIQATEILKIVDAQMDVMKKRVASQGRQFIEGIREYLIGAAVGGLALTTARHLAANWGRPLDYALIYRISGRYMRGIALAGPYVGLEMSLQSAAQEVENMTHKFATDFYLPPTGPAGASTARGHKALRQAA